MTNKTITREIAELSKKLKKTSADREVRLVAVGIKIDSGDLVTFDANHEQLLYKVYHVDQDGSGRDVAVLRLVNRSKTR